MQRLGRLVCPILSVSLLVISGCATKILPAKEPRPRDFSSTRAEEGRFDQMVVDMNKRADELEKQAAEERDKAAAEIEKHADDILKGASE